MARRQIRISRRSRPGVEALPRVIAPSDIGVPDAIAMIDTLPLPETGSDPTIIAPVTPQDPAGPILC